LGWRRGLSRRLTLCTSWRLLRLYWPWGLRRLALSWLAWSAWSASLITSRWICCSIRRCRSCHRISFLINPSHAGRSTSATNRCSVAMSNDDLRCKHVATGRNELIQVSNWSARIIRLVRIPIKGEAHGFPVWIQFIQNPAVCHSIFAALARSRRLGAGSRNSVLCAIRYHYKEVEGHAGGRTPW
jgi:hypothetical protein